ncbi:MAG: MOSC domain-containing protein, partial [Clostridiales bacterium]|nr:MOSC domain-containing protein [Clostridiales bacterium]
MGRLTAICISEKRGTPKHEISEADLMTDWGIKGDAHGGNWHRQVSLLSAEKIEEFRKRGAVVEDGAFGENLIVEGFDLRTFPTGTRFQIGDAMLEMTQIGKECHNHCLIYQTMGDCIMPREGVFAKVIKAGHIRKGDEIIMLSPEKDRPFTAAVITLSDKGAAGEREDKSGPTIVSLLEEKGY